MKLEVYATRVGRASAVALLAAGLCIALSGCGLIGAQPWERDLMARREMQLNTHPLITSADEHIYFSKEGSSGGRTFDGGGCGCN